MRDKLYKTHRKKSFYRVRKLVVGFSFVLLATASLVVPYHYVSAAVLANQNDEEIVETVEELEAESEE